MIKDFNVASRAVEDTEIPREQKYEGTEQELTGEASFRRRIEHWSQIFNSMGLQCGFADFYAPTDSATVANLIIG